MQALQLGGGADLGDAVSLDQNRAVLDYAIFIAEGQEDPVANERSNDSVSHVPPRTALPRLSL
jgi:hypothetical protein